MNDMRIMKLWMVWEYQFLKDMRISNYEWYENIKLWMIWEYKNYEWYENIKFWMIWEYQIMNGMRI